uniref:SET domain-containing protein n=1 Tax=Mycena chlorophos TaxID=658473 RepID=A0ABQ0M558_MYCCL|nr:predicted protein [Mycena chlorophos]
MSSRTTTLLTATAISVSALVAYALYFDYKRRTDSAFRKQLRKQKKRVDKSLAESREALQAASQVTDEELREALKAIEEEPKPGPEMRENYFMSQVAMGEQLAARGEAFVLPAALSFYRALAVYPSPSELLGIYQKTVPDEIVKVILRIINLDVSAPPQDLGIDEGDASPTRGPPSETSSQEWDKVTDPGSQTPVSRVCFSVCFGAFETELEFFLLAYYEVFPPKSSHVTIQPRPDVPVSFGPEKVLVLTEDVAAGQVIYKEKPMLACLDYDLQTAGTHCTHCFRELSTVASPETLTSSADGTKSKFCSKACLQAAKTRWFGFLMSMDPPLPAIVELGGLPVTPETLDARRTAQAQLVAYLKKDSRAGAFLVAQFIARQLTMAGSKDLNPDEDFAGVDIQEYRIEDHVERWTTAPISPPEEEYGLLVAMLKRTVPGLEEFLSEDSHKSLVGKLVFAAFGVCFGEGREDRPASSLRPEDSELTRTPLGTARQVGTAIYSISSHLPHSCEPNARPVFSSGTTELEIVANKDLKKGDQLSIAYVEVGQRPDESEKDSLPTTTTAPAAASVAFTPLYVGDEGISVSHLQLTARSQSRSEAVSNNRRARYVSLTCLICQTLVYRVQQIVPLDADTRDGPLLPTEDWVEQDLLKSSSGWIEVHEQCLAGDAIAKAEASSQYVPLFAVTVPAQPARPASPSEPIAAQDGPKPAFLEHLPPMFLPPPFTPGNPAYTHLSSIATAESNEWRSAAEDEIAAFIRAKTEQLLRSEAVLRSQVETIYARFRAGLQAAQQSDVASPRSPLWSTQSGAADYGFVPLPVAPVRHEVSASMSALSASLAANGMHHPRARQQQAVHAQQSQAEPTSPVSTVFDSIAGTSPTLTVGSGAVPPPSGREFAGESNLLDIPRRMDENLNTVASFRWMQMEHAAAHQAQRRAAEEAQQREQQQQQQPARTELSNAAPVAGPSTAAGNSSSTDGQPPAESSQANGKGKKKVVTFQSQPAVVTIKDKEEEERSRADDVEEMVFELDTDDKDDREVSMEGTVLTLVETPPQRPPQPRRTSGGRKTSSMDTAGLPASFAALRPSSLPAISHLRGQRSPLRPLNDAPETPHQQRQQQQQEQHGGGGGVDDAPEEEYDSRDHEIRKLVAAHNPSHRNAWKKGSSEWKAFVSGRNNGRRSSLSDEDESVSPPPPPIASSMPIAIRPLGRQPVRLTLASYTGGAEVPAEEETNAAATMPSSSLRNSMYAQRDIHRDIDPGALEFSLNNGAIPEESEEEEEEFAEGAGAADEERLGRGGDRALRILQARSELPDASMFYSLAS